MAALCAGLLTHIASGLVPGAALQGSGSADVLQTQKKDLILLSGTGGWTTELLSQTRAADVVQHHG